MRWPKFLAPSPNEAERCKNKAFAQTEAGRGTVVVIWNGRPTFLRLTVSLTLLLSSAYSMLKDVEVISSTDATLIHGQFPCQGQGGATSSSSSFRGVATSISWWCVGKSATDPHYGTTDNNIHCNNI